MPHLSRCCCHPIRRASCLSVAPAPRRWPSWMSRARGRAVVAMPLYGTMVARATSVGRARPSASANVWASWSHRSRPTKAWMSRAHCRTVSLFSSFPFVSLCRRRRLAPTSAPEIGHLYSIRLVRTSALTSPRRPTPHRLDDGPARRHFGVFPSVRH